MSTIDLLIFLGNFRTWEERRLAESRQKRGLHWFYHDKVVKEQHNCTNKWAYPMILKKMRIRLSNIWIWRMNNGIGVSENGKWLINQWILGHSVQTNPRTKQEPFYVGVISHKGIQKSGLIWFNHIGRYSAIYEHTCANPSQMKTSQG